MDCAYKNDGGANVASNVADKVLDTNNLFLERNLTHVCTKSSASVSGELQTVVTNGSHQLHVECNENKSSDSGFSLDKQILSSNNNESNQIINETNEVDEELKQKVTLDSFQEPCERTAKTKCFDVEVSTHQLDSEQSSQELKDLESKKKSFGLQFQEEESAINGQLPDQKLTQNSTNQTKQKLAQNSPNQTKQNPSIVVIEENWTFSNPVSTILEEDRLEEECANAKLGHSLVGEIGNNAIEDNQMSSGSGVICQSVDTPFSSENIDECVSDEEVYLEVESDQVSDVASENEEETLADENILQIGNDCSKTIDVLVKSVEDEKPACELSVEEIESDPLTLPLKISQHHVSQEEFMSDEVYEEVEEDIDEELDSEKQEELNNGKEMAEVKMDVDGECVGSVAPAESPNSSENEEFKDDSVESHLDQVLPADVDKESDCELRKSVNEESNCNEKKNEDSNENLVEKKLESESGGVNLLDDLEVKSSIELMESISEEGPIIKKKDEIIKEEHTEDELLVIDEDDEEMNEFNLPLTPAEEEKLLNISVNTEEKVEDDSKKLNSAMDISEEVSQTVCISDTNTDRVTECKVEENLQEKVNNEKSPKKVLDSDDFDELDSAIEEFVVKECASEDAKPESRKSEILFSESEDELEVIMEGFKAENSDDDCLIVEDTSKEIVINVDYASSKGKNSKSSPLKIDTRAAPDVTNNIERNISQMKSVAIEENLDSSNIATNAQLKDAVDKLVSIMAVSPVSEHATNSDTIDQAKQQEYIESTVDKSNISKFGLSESRIVESVSDTVVNLSSELANKSQCDTVTEDKSGSNGVELNSSSNHTDIALVGNKLSLNSGLFSEIDSEKSLVKNCVGTDESIQAGVEVVMSNLITETCPTFSGTKDCSDKLKSVSDSNEINHQPVGHELNSKFSSVLSEGDEGSSEEVGMDEIIIDSVNLQREVIEPSSSAADLCEKPFIKDDSKKRLFEEIEGDHSVVVNKKSKHEEIAIEIPYDSNSKLQRKIQEKTLELFPQENTFKFVTTKKILDRIAQHVLRLSLEDAEPAFHKEAMKKVKQAEDCFQVLDEEFQLFNVQVTDLVGAQDEKFQQHNFNPQVQTRTVGVNVKIFRECDLQNYSSAGTSQTTGQIPRPAGTSVANKATPPVSVGKSLLPSRPSNPASTRPLVQTPQLPSVRRPLAPPNVTITSKPGHVIPGQRFTSVNPNVTIAGNPLQSILTNSVANRPPAPNAGLVPNSAQAPNSNRLIDLTGDGSITRRPVSTISSATPSTTIPSLPTNQNVLLPSYFQILPPTTTQNNIQFTAGNQLQLATTRTQSVLQPTFRPATAGSAPRTFAYLMPSGSAQLANFGARGGIALPPFLTTSNQRVTPFLTSGNPRLQTIVVRVTNPGQSTPLSSIVSSTPRIQAPSNSLLNTGTITTATAGGGLVLFPRAAAKHPAPFPQAPVYAPNPKLKLLPPKPTLKGSRAPQQGIILSWNMILHSSHAEISNYQLYAYQETNAVVTSALWKRVGDVKALPLPMACTLTQFIEGHRYYFTVRAVDANGRFGPFSDAVNIMYSKQDDSQASNK